MLNAIRAAWHTLCVATHLAYIAIKFWMRRWCKTSTTDARAYAVYAFKDGDALVYKDIPLRYFDPASWESDVHELTGWDEFRVEIRYTYRHKKYRMVLHQGDTCVFPPYTNETMCRLPKGVLSARLQGAKGSNIDHDVTHRVIKYQGPRGDFHTGLGLHVTLQEMFPFDDHADNAARFTHLRLIDTMARVHDFAYDTDPCVDI